MKATVFGAMGFIGTHLVRSLRASGFVCDTPMRGTSDWKNGDLGHVFYCAGLTADFRKRPLDAIDAHVGYLNTILRHGSFASLLYLSSTRVYLGAGSTREDAVLSINPNVPDDLYNLSKLLGEAAVLGNENPAARVARLSNVYGPGMGAANFLGSIVRDALQSGTVTFGTGLTSEKDYVSVDTVVRALSEIAINGRYRLYNVASGRSTTHRAIAERLATLTACRVSVAPSAPSVKFRAIDVTRLRERMECGSSNVITDLDALVADARERLT